MRRTRKRAERTAGRAAGYGARSPPKRVAAVSRLVAGQWRSRARRFGSAHARSHRVGPSSMASGRHSSTSEKRVEAVRRVRRVFHSAAAGVASGDSANPRRAPFATSRRLTPRRSNRFDSCRRIRGCGQRGLLPKYGYYAYRLPGNRRGSAVSGIGRCSSPLLSSPLRSSPLRSSPLHSPLAHSLDACHRISQRGYDAKKRVELRSRLRPP